MTIYKSYTLTELKDEINSIIRTHQDKIKESTDSITIETVQKASDIFLFDAAIHSETRVMLEAFYNENIQKSKFIQDGFNKRVYTDEYVVYFDTILDAAKFLSGCRIFLTYVGVNVNDSIIGILYYKNRIAEYFPEIFNSSLLSASKQIKQRRNEE